MENKFMQEKMDSKRFILCFLRKGWVLGGALLAGALLGMISYLVVREVRMPVEYAAVSKVYLRFIWDPAGEVEQHYNAYTWNDLMGTDPILDRTMEELKGSGIDRETVRAATKAEIISDYRLLTLTFTTEEEGKTGQIQKAAEKGLVAYGRESEEITHIEVISSSPPELKVWDNRTLNAGVGGGILGLMLAVFCLWIYLITDDGFYVGADVKRRYPYPFLGLLTAKTKAGAGAAPYGNELEANLQCFVAGKQRVILVNPSGAQAPDVPRLIMEEIMKQPEQAAPELQAMSLKDGETAVCEQIRHSDGAILTLPYGNRSGKQTERFVQMLEQQNLPILGILIMEGRASFWDCYYGGKGKPV